MRTLAGVAGAASASAAAAGGSVNANVPESSTSAESPSTLAGEIEGSDSQGGPAAAATSEAASGEESKGDGVWDERSGAHAATNAPSPTNTPSTATTEVFVPGLERPINISFSRG